MKIKIVKDLISIAPSYRPIKDHAYEVEEVTAALDNRCHRNGYVIKVNDHRTMVFEDEFEVIEEQEEDHAEFK